MKKTEHFELINGVFSAQLTHEILIDMLNKKIQFHTLKLHENWEKNSQDETSSNVRISELEATRNRLQQFLASNQKGTFKVQSTITIELLNEF